MNDFIRARVMRALDPQSEAPFELRRYAEGEDARRIDWPASARTGVLHVRLSHGREILWAALLDDSAPMRCGRVRAPSVAAHALAEAWLAMKRDGDRTLFMEVRDRGIADAAQDFLSRGFSDAALLLITSTQRAGAIAPAMLTALRRSHDCTALLARDPWRDDLALEGLVRVRDASGDRSAVVCIRTQERRRYLRAAHALERFVTRRFRTAGWRIDLFDECEGAAALLRAFAPC